MTLLGVILVYAVIIKSIVINECLVVTFLGAVTKYTAMITTFHVTAKEDSIMIEKSLVVTSLEIISTYTIMLATFHVTVKEDNSD